jgi:hypothetical protein
LHQPLHVGFLDDAGGTKTIITFRGKQQKLHQLWDAGILNTQQGSAREWAARLDEEFPIRKNLRWLRGSPAEWANDRWLSRGNTCTRYPNLEK